VSRARLPRTSRPSLFSHWGKAPHTIMRIAPDQRVIRTRANRAYARFARWPTIPPSLCCCGQDESSSRARRIETAAARRQATRQHAELRLSRRLERSRGRRTGMALRALRYDFSGAPPVWVRGAAREGCSWLVWLGGESDRWRRLRCRRLGRVQTTREGANGCPRGSTCPRGICCAEVRTAGRPRTLKVRSQRGQ